MKLIIGYDAKRYFLNRTGLGNYSRDLIRILEDHYPENRYIKYSPKFDGFWFGSEDFKQTNKLPQGFINNLFPSLWRNRRIVEDLKHDQVQIFHGLSGEIPIGLKEAKIKSVVTIHDLIFLRYPELYKPLDRWIYHRKAKYAIEHADRIIAISEQTKKDILQFYQVDEQKIEVIYQVCHPAFKQTISEDIQNRIRQENNLPERFILNVGSIEPRKNAFQIVKAIENTGIPLLILGKETPYADEIKAYIKEKGMEKQVIFLKGFTMEELAAIYRMASIFVYPSKFEGFGIPIIEALYAGTPVITNRSGVFPEAAGPDSMYIDPENIQEMREQIVGLWNNPEKRQEMSEKGKRYVQRFNDEKIAAQIMNCYNTL